MKRNLFHQLGAAPLIACVFVAALLIGGDVYGQGRRGESQTSHSRNVLSGEALELVDLASTVVCRERITDPKGSVPIDDMQSRPSLPVQSPEAVAGAKRAQRLLPTAKALVASSLRLLARDYNLTSSAQAAKVQRAIRRVMAVNYVRPDMDSRDNASVFLHNPHTIIFGTIFLAGLPSDEGIVAVLSHELVHIGDGGEDSLALLFRNIGIRASKLTGTQISGQRAEELSCDLVGTLAARAFVAREPNYEPLPRRISRSLAHNCVEQDEGDNDHLSPRTTIRALLSLAPDITRALVYGR
ncbi:MAG TPA: hypothetical protein VJU86_09385 [Pyrinomonadaceae bacterium]|nr:hypothetical protein [Pyrinomonadaceae bacterium]